MVPPALPVVIAALHHELKPLIAELSPDHAHVIASGIGPAQAARSVAMQLGQPLFVISTGCCGGLSSEARPGTVVVPSSLLDQQPPALLPDPALQAALRQCALQRGVHVLDGALLTVPQPLLTSADKAFHGSRTGAIAVDMESAAIARVAHSQGVPFCCIRVVVDPLDVSFPVANSRSAKQQAFAAFAVEVARQMKALAQLIAAFLATTAPR